MKLANFVGFGVVALLGAASASADIIPTFVNTTAGAITGDDNYNYSAVVDSSENVISGNELCLSGITGLVLGSEAAPTGWTVLSQSLTAGCSINAGAGSPNTGASITWQYTGATIDGQANLGTFSFESSDTAVGTLNDAYGAVAVKNVAGGGGATANQGEVNGPIAPPSTTPEPATISLFGFGLVGIGLLKRRNLARK